ncbi:MAG: SpoIIE family protein phosphatase [Acidobacteriota bacterium]|nr:SpoIIE family protein phosphatase [Acidobacteriota bacterium]
MACLLRVTQELNGSSDLDAGLSRVGTLLKQYVPYETLSVLLLDDLGRELRFAYGAGFPEEIINHWRFGNGQGVVGTVASEGRAIRVDDVTQDPRYIAASRDVRSELALPLIAQDRVIGVLDIGGPTTAFFSEQDERLLGFLADHLAGAIEGARLYQNMREQARTLSLLHEISREVAAILDRRPLLKRVAERVKRLIDYDLFTVLLWNEDKQLLEPTVSVFGDGRKNRRASSVALGQGICGTAAALAQPIRVPNIHLDPRYIDCSSGVDVLSELVVPLVFKGSLIGVLDLESTRYDAFSQHHQQLLSTLGSSLAIALENARLYEQLRADEERLEADLSTAREVQKQLLPEKAPVVRGLDLGVAYEPARHLGGDFFDFLSYDDDRLALAVGDVAGKATSAALYGSLAIGTLREIAGSGDLGPSQVLADLNEKLGRLELGNRFVAMGFAVWNGGENSLTIANSGLPYPYLLSGGRVERIELGGVPLGLLSNQGYLEETRLLEPGDTLVLASDGIEESLDSAGEEFGRVRLETLLEKLAGRPAQEIADALLRAVRRYSGAAEISDDRTVVVLKLDNSNGSNDSKVADGPRLVK